MAYDTSKIFSPQLYIHGASYFVSVGVLFHTEISFGEWLNLQHIKHTALIPGKRNDAGQCLNKSEMFFHQFPRGGAVPLSPKSVTEFSIIFIWKGTLNTGKGTSPWRTGGNDETEGKLKEQQAQIGGSKETRARGRVREGRKELSDKKWTSHRDDADVFETKCHLPSVLTLSQSRKSERRTGARQISKEAKHVAYLKTNPGGGLGFSLPLTECEEERIISIFTAQQRFSSLQEDKVHSLF